MKGICGRWKFVSIQRNISRNDKNEKSFEIKHFKR